jgi:hypothetical protein
VSKLDRIAIDIHSIIWLITRISKIDNVTLRRVPTSRNPQTINLPRMQLDNTLADLEIQPQATLRPSTQVIRMIIDNLAVTD